MFSEDNFTARLSTLTETQDSIVGISQWVLFYKRYATDIAGIWQKYLEKAPTGKKLGLVYLANEVVQNARARKKDEFVQAFGAVMPAALASAHRQTSKEVRDKIKRVVDVWRQRQIFGPAVLAAIDTQIKDGRPGALSGSLDALAPPPELKDASDIQKQLNDTDILTTKLQANAVKEYKDLFDTDMLPAPPEYSRKLYGLKQSLSSSILSLGKTIELRRQFVEQLQKLIDTNKARIASDEKLLADFGEKLKHATETKKEIDQMLVEDTLPEQQQESTIPPMASPIEKELEPTKDEEEHEEYVPSVVSSLPGFGTSLLSGPAAPSAVIDDDATPEYAALSSDEEDDSGEPNAKKQKTEEKPIEVKSHEQQGQSQPDAASLKVEGLDPAVAQFLSSMINKSS
ncbi:regulator of Ty1 transposition protein 103 [Trichomonascus vanleenenianus]|uniref:CTD-interacting domain-containing protein n=1 Tax=Trichomonascus vanleenenianus TaxID=2268995 RepID=UPI003EC9B53C